MTQKKFYLKERYNPQLGTYYVKCGQLGKQEAAKKENSLYGTNTMRAFDTKEQYEAEIARLVVTGEKVQ